MKICILTQPLRTNYGGLLQAFALQKVLSDMGHEVVTDSEGAKPPMPFYKRMLYFGYHLLKRYLLGDKRYNPFRYLFTCLDKEPAQRKQIAVHTDRFIKNNIQTVDFFAGSIKPKQEILEQFDAFVVGSDQVWRAAYSYVPSYFLGFSKDMSVKRLTYAASFGKDNIGEYKLADLNKCKASVKFFDAVSVREDSGVSLFKSNFGADAMHVLDPTMLLEKEDYLATIEQEDKAARKNIMMCYILDKSDDKRAIIDTVANHFNLNPLEVMPKREFEVRFDIDLTDYIYPAVSKWLAGFRDAEFVITDSFHGTVFALIFNKPFIAIANGERGASRFTSLLKIFGLESRLIYSLQDLTPDHFLPIDYNAVNKTKAEWQAKSTAFLTNALK